MPNTTPLFIGINGTVLAIDRGTGQEVWRSELKGSDFVNVVIDDGQLYATTKGELSCLDPATGEIRWQNDLKGLGRGLVTIASAGGSGIAVMSEKRRRDQAAAGASGAAAAG
jgi:outer membrane protein assembly factor BamB